MDSITTNIWLISALWLGLALVASLISIRIAMAVALVEIVVGAVAGNLIGLHATEWVDYLASLGAVMLTFLAGAEIDPKVIRNHVWSSVSIGLMGFLAPFLGGYAYTHLVCGWPWEQAAIAGITLSGVSVAVTFAVLVETQFNKTEIGKIILASCFVNNIGTILALGLIFANYNMWLLLFIVATALAMWMLPKVTPWFFERVGHRISEPEIKFVFCVVFLLGGLAKMGKSEAILPAYLIGMVLAATFLKDRVLSDRMRVIAFSFFTPFYFLKAGSLIKFDVLVGSAGLILILLAVKLVTKFAGIFPLTRLFRFQKPDDSYTTLMMSTGLTFGSICALFGFTEGIISQQQYTVLISAVIGSAIVPTIIAQKLFQPEKALEETEAGKGSEAGEVHVTEKVGTDSDGSNDAVAQKPEVNQSDS